MGLSESTQTNAAATADGIAASKSGPAPKSISFTATGVPIAAFFDAERNSIIVVTRTSLEYYRADTGMLKDVMTPKKTAWTNCAIYCPEKDWLLTGDADARLRLFQASTGQLQKMFPDATVDLGTSPEILSTASARALLQLPRKPTESDKVLCGLNNGTVVLWDIDNGQELLRLSPPEAASAFASVSPPSPTSPRSDEPSPPATTPPPVVPSSAGLVTNPALSLTYDAHRQWVFVGYADGCIRAYHLTNEGPLKREIRGHQGPVVAVQFIRHVDVVVSAGADRTIRAWDIELGDEVCGYQLATYTATYDPMRDLLFSGGVDGVLYCTKVFHELAPPSPPNTASDSAAVSKIEMNILRRLGSPGSPLVALWYHSETDTMATAASDNRVTVWRGLTGVPHDAAAQQAAAYEALMSDDNRSALLKELVDGDTGPPQVGSLPKIQAEERLLALSLKLIAGESDDARQRRDKLTTQFAGLKKNLEQALADAYRQWSARRRDLAGRTAALLDPSRARSELEHRFEAAREEMRKRHERERRELEDRYFAEKRALEARGPAVQRHVAEQYVGLKAQLAKEVYELENGTAYALRKLLLSSYPVVKARYQLGKDPIAPHASSVFRAIDYYHMELVAVKAFPSLVSLNTTLKHDTLVEVIDVCKTEGTTFVVMRLMKETLAEYVARQPDGVVTEKKVAEIVATLLSCLSFLHSQRMVMRDLRPQNVLMNDEALPRVVHLGVMRALTGEEPAEEGWIYAAPELFAKAINTASDMWSLGVMMAYLLMTPDERRSPLFHGESAADVLASMVGVIGRPEPAELEELETHYRFEGLLKTLPAQPTVTPLASRISRASPSAISLLSRLLVFSPSKRLTAVEALHHEYFSILSASTANT